jgi:hypothetical protein
MLSGTMSCGELCQPAPAEDPQSDGADALADFSQMLVHGIDADWRHDQAGTARRAVFDKLRWRRRGKPPPAIPTGFACRNLWPASPR